MAQPAPNNNYEILNDAKIAVPLRNLSNFWRSLEMPWINCEVELKLKWTKNCALAPPGDDNFNANTNDVIFTLKDTKLYIPVVDLSTENNQEISKFLSKRFETSVYSNEYKTKIENENATNEYSYFLESTFVGINGLIVLVYSNEDDNEKRFKNLRYYLHML